MNPQNKFNRMIPNRLLKFFADRNARFQRRWKEPQVRRRELYTGAILLVLLGIVIWFFGRGAAEEEAPLLVSVRVAKAERQVISATTTAIGTMGGRRQAVVSAKIGGVIRKMELIRNRVVHEGEVIATLESRDLQAQRDEAAAALQEVRATLRGLSSGNIPQIRAQDEKAVRDATAKLANARVIYERRQALYKEGGIPKRELEAAQLAFTTAESELHLAEQTAQLHRTSMNPNDRASAEARVKAAENRLVNLDAQLSYTALRAPFSGIITDQFQFQGEYLAAGGRLFSIADMHEVIVKVPFADTIAAQLKAEDPATVLPMDFPGEKYVGRISLVSRATDPINRMVEVWVVLRKDTERLRTNGAAQVIVTTKTVPDAIVVPTAAVTLEATNEDVGSVMVVDRQSIAHEIKVRTGIRTPELTEILSGLQGGETVVIEGNYALPDGAKVQTSESTRHEKEARGGKTGESRGGRR